MNVWLELLRFGYHLVSVAEVPLVFTKIGPDARFDRGLGRLHRGIPRIPLPVPGGYVVRLGHPDGRGSAL